MDGADNKDPKDQGVHVFGLTDDGQQTPLFDPPADQPVQNKLTPEQTKMTSTLATFAQQMNDLSTENMDSIQKINEDKIAMGQESQLRSSIAEQQRQSRITDLQKLQAEALKTNPQDYAVSDAFKAEQDAVFGEPNQAALEQDGAHGMQAQQPTGDGTALGAYLGGARTEQSGYAAKVAIFNTEMDRLKTEADAESPVGKTRDFLLGLSGFEDWNLGTHYIKGQGSLFKLPAQNINEQSRFLWSQNPQDFRKYLTDAIEYSKFYGAGPAYNMLSKFAGPMIGTIGQSTLGYNFWQYAGPAAYIPVAKMMRFASGAARVVGNRGLSTNLATAGIAARSAGITSGMEHVQPIEASIAETIPSVSIPDTSSLARGDVGVVSDVADRLDALKTSVDSVKATIQRTARVEPSQLREMIDKGVKQAENTYRDSPVADIKRDVIPPEIVSTATVETQGGRTYMAIRRSKTAGPPQKYIGPETGEVPHSTIRLNDQTKPAFDTGEVPRDLSGQVFTAEQVDHVLNSDVVHLDEFENLPALNEHGELRPATFEDNSFNPDEVPAGKPFDTGEVPDNAKPYKPVVVRGRVKSRGESAKTLRIDNDTDIDTLSHWNARGEVYADLPKDTARVNPFPVDELGSGALNILPGAKKFVVARKMPDGTIRMGEPGQIHADLIGDDELDRKSVGFVNLDEKDMGFADRSGKFYTRAEASAALKRPGILESSELKDHESGRIADVERQIKNIQDETANANLGGSRSVPEVIRSPSTGLYSLRFYVGKDQTTGGFLTQEGAAAAASRRGFANPKVIQTLDGHWYIEATHVLPETGLTTKVVSPQDFPAYWKASEFVKSLDGLQAQLHNEARKGAVLSKGRYLADVVGPYAKNIKKLNGRQLATLSSVLKSGEAEHTWFSMPELYDKYNQLEGRIPSTKEALAYYSAKELSDLAYHVFNDRVYLPMARDGYETIQIANPEVSFDTGRVNARVIPADAAKGERIYVADTGDVSDGIRKNVQAMIDTGHYKMVELRSPMMRDGQPTKYVLSHDETMTREPLERQQLNYNPGGSREYANKWFVKQANYTLDDAGHRTWLDPLTHVTAPLYKQAIAYAEGMERARLAYVSDIPEAEKRLIIDRTPIESYDKFDQMVKAGTIHPDTPFEALADKQDPEAMTRIGVNDTNWTNPSVSGEESYYRTQARLYYGEKGERLRDPQGGLAQTLNPLSTLRRAVYNAANTNALGDYNTKVIEDWAKAAAPFLDYKSVSLNPSPWETFFNGKFIRGLGPEQQRLVAGMDIARNSHKRFMGMRDLEQTTQTMYLKKLGMELENKGPLGEKAAAVVYSRLNSDPIGVTRDLVFHGYFGFGNLRRFVLHASQAVGAIAVDPLRGLDAAGMAPITAALVHINRSDKVLDYMASKMSGSLGMTVANYRDMVQSLRYSGWLNIGGEVAQLDRYSDRWGGTLLTKGWDATKKYGIVPFHAAIGLQRLMAYHMAWGMAKELMPEEAVFSARFQGFVNNKADALTGNMTTASSAAWQKGVWGIPTQFMSWQARMVENLLPQTFGGSKALSQSQKMRYLLGQAALWGTAGVPVFGAGYDIISDLYRQNTGQQIDEDTHRAVTKGLVDSMIHGFTGADTDMASEAGLGSGLNRTIEGFRSGELNPFLQFLGGPAFDTGNVALDKFGHFLTYMKAEQTDSVSSAQFKLAFQDALPLVQAFKFDQKAYWAYKYKTLYDDKTGQPIIDDATTADAVFAGLGVPNVWESARGPMYQTQQDLEQTVDDVAKQVVKLRREQDAASTAGDTDKMAQIENVVRVVMQPYRDRPLLQQQIAKRSTELMTRGYTGTEKQQLIQRSIKNTGFPPAEANPSPQTVPGDE